jgi:hypothetical protein
MTRLAILAALMACVSGPRSPALLPADPIEVIAASPAAGFWFPYVLYVPAGNTGETDLLVEPNNTGRTSDDFDVHLKAAIVAADGSTNSIGHFVAREVGLPLLVPAFPRPAALRLTYTHALDRDTMLVDQPPLRRLDLQLIAMIHDARRRLAERHVIVRERVVLTGFSASGAFVNRFMFLHPDLVKGVAAGALGVPMFPIAELDGRKLDYPLGVHDDVALTGTPFAGAIVKQVPQFIYVGELDENDPVEHGDAFSETERETIYALLGKKKFPERWERCRQLYEKTGMNATFKSYPGIGHGTNRAINLDVAAFFKGLTRS